eukprot:scaffold26481_cov123-Isochrysis_galbana.AAC.1
MQRARSAQKQTYTQSPAPRSQEEAKCRHGALLLLHVARSVASSARSSVGSASMSDAPPPPTDEDRHRDRDRDRGPPRRDRSRDRDLDRRDRDYDRRDRDNDRHVCLCLPSLRSSRCGAACACAGVPVGLSANGRAPAHPAPAARSSCIRLQGRAQPQPARRLP